MHVADPDDGMRSAVDGLGSRNLHRQLDKLEDRVRHGRDSLAEEMSLVVNEIEQLSDVVQSQLQ